MAARLYSLYRLYGNRWVRVGTEALHKEQAEIMWKAKVSQGSFDYLGVKYKILPIPKSEIRRKITEEERDG